MAATWIFSAPRVCSQKRTRSFGAVLFAVIAIIVVVAAIASAVLCILSIAILIVLIVIVVVGAIAVLSILGIVLIIVVIAVLLVEAVVVLFVLIAGIVVVVFLIDTIVLIEYFVLAQNDGRLGIDLDRVVGSLRDLRQQEVEAARELEQLAEDAEARVDRLVQAVDRARAGVGRVHEQRGVMHQDGAYPRHERTGTLGLRLETRHDGVEERQHRAARQALDARVNDLGAADGETRLDQLRVVGLERLHQHRLQRAHLGYRVRRHGR